MKMLREILASSSRPIFLVSVTATEPYIHRLPVELLQQIFLSIVNSAPGYPSIFSCGFFTISTNVASPPLVLTRVCHHWRNVAHSTAGVWSRIQVVLPGEVRSFGSFLPHFLQCWLARSVSSPLTLHIVNRAPCLNWTITAANSRILNILLSESKRWETVVMAMPLTCDWDLNFDTPQLRALECGAPDLKKFYAPNISRLYITTRRGYLASPTRLCIPFYKNLRHLHLRDAYVCALCSAITDFPRLETIVIDEIYSLNHVPSARSSSYSATLESMTLPLPFSRRWRQGFIDMFSLLDLPTSGS
ncbi:hypothetical protein F4604DRAFT_2026229 [Suillus subluteus]|nr:hypothetical protein F4604DRAFT_2026229 [Suillus subluteus]